MNDNRRFGQLSPNKTFFYYIWFRGVKLEEEKITQGLDYCGPAKKKHKVFLLVILEKITEEWTVGSHLVMKITTKFTGDRPFMGI